VGGSQAGYPVTDTDWMQRCLALAVQGLGRTAPNPMVGAVIVKAGEVLAEGWHQAPGMAHAEVVALDRLGGRAPGATMYVNLEPCCHQGRTPPCTDAIIAAGVSRVVVGMVDPDKRMQGAGMEQLRAAGIAVDVGIEREACRTLNHAYLSAQERGRPWVTVKAAITLDGRIADAEGASQWITSEVARAVGHRLRDEHDAVMVGAGTLRADDPSLNTRTEGGRDALPVILDTELRCAVDAKVLTAGRRPVLFHAADVSHPTGLDADMVGVDRDAHGWLDLNQVLANLQGRGVHSVLVEGGGQLIRSLLDHAMVDRIELFIAGRVLAGGPGWVGGAPMALSHAPGFHIVRSDTVGPDLHVVLEQPACSAES
jgi:diaminohydroxyphosphoribosylaminopyrimidine deaminase / 5-amino-6-(5-phosphoribosylamino)uracil reductase